MQDQFGLFEVFSAPDPLVDIVFVHGLNGNPYNTWTASNRVFWPRELLPKFLPDQRCRILTYGYNANVSTFTDGVSKDNILNHAENLAAYLVANRSGALERPILFVCHSLGGLVVKRCLILCRGITSTKTEPRRSVYISTYGIVFLGTPHAGSSLAKWGSMLQSIASATLPRKLFDSQPHLVDALKSNNEILQNINAEFVTISPRLHIYFFHEAKPTDLKGTRQFIVEEHSAAPMLEGVERAGIERDHSTMCKFEDENAPGFKLVAEALNRYAREAPTSINISWQAEQRIRDVERQRSAIDLLGPENLQNQPRQPSLGVPSIISPIDTDVSTPLLIEPPGHINAPASPTYSEHGTMTVASQTLVAPLGFRPNSIFVGFSIELARLEHKLQNTRGRDFGSSSALLWGPPGCGKSHLAREYVWRHRAEYSTGVFWVDCKTVGALNKGFWEIAQALGCLSSVVTPTEDAAIVESVRQYLSGCSSWLMVFDGIYFKTDQQLTDFRRYIPDSKGGHIIYTTVDRTLSHRHRLLDPSGIKIYPLSSDDGLLLLFNSLHLGGKPNSLQIEKGRQLVQHYDGLPLGIHAAAYMLSARGRPLEKYSPGPSDQRLSGPYLEIFAALQESGAIEALNLLTLLSFINHEVPVKLLNLGRRFLLEKFEVEIRSTESGSNKRELDNSISLLIKNGILERLLQPTSASGEAGRSSPETLRTYGRDKPAALKDEDSTGLENLIFDAQSSKSPTTTVGIDVVRLHTVVQTVVLENLKTSPQKFYRWLAIVTLFLCNSYRRARKEMQGHVLISDHKEYETHAAKLESHYPRHPKDPPDILRKAQHELHQLRKAIQEEIKTPSPSQSSDSSSKRLFGSVFERSGSSSDEGPATPNSGITRVSTWSVDPSANQTESPLEERHDDHSNLEISWTEDIGYISDYEQNPRRNERTTSGSTERSNEARQSALQAIFQGRAGSIHRHKDLGEWKPVPSIGPVSIAEAELVHSRTSSSSSPARPISAGSQAEAALAAVHRMSPPSFRGGRKVSSSRTSTDRTPLGDLPVNVPHETDSSEPRNPRKVSVSPRLMQSVLSSNAIRAQLPIEENISITRPVNRTSQVIDNGYHRTTSDPSLEYRTLPSGYSSQPMSRDTSKESNLSLQSEPADVSFSVSPPHSYLTQRNIAQVTESEILKPTEVSEPPKHSVDPLEPSVQIESGPTAPYPISSDNNLSMPERDS